MPLRHPGRWVATAVLLVLAAMFVHDVITNPRFGWGVVGNYFFSTPDRDRGREDPRAHVRRHGGRGGPRRALRRDAAVAQPHLVGCSMALHLVLPGHAGLRPAPLLVRHLGSPADDQPRHTLRAGVRPHERQQHRHARSWRLCSGSGSTKAPTTPRSCGPGSSRSTTGSSRRPNPSACAG